jgi:hypothetical protein
MRMMNNENSQLGEKRIKEREIGTRMRAERRRLARFDIL